MTNSVLNYTQFVKRMLKSEALSKKYNDLAGFILLTLVMALSSCGPQAKLQDPHNLSLKKYSNAFLWQQVQKNPAIFHPKQLPSGYAINNNSGEWFTESRTGAKFFAPKRECGGLSAAIWRKEAQKATAFIRDSEPPETRIPDQYTASEKIGNTFAEEFASFLFTLPFQMLFGDSWDDDDDEWHRDRPKRSSKKPLQDECNP